MPVEDQFGVRLTAATGSVAAGYDAALGNLLTLSGDPVADADEALRQDPACVMAHVLKGVASVLGTDVAQHPPAIAAATAASALAAGATEREQNHVLALRAWLDGRFPDAAAHWEAILIDEPNDALAMFAAHQADFLLGASSELRDRVTRRLPDVRDSDRLRGYYYGMLAFGLEETGDYARALDAGLHAVERDPRDAWAIHAVAHVHEMTQAAQAGIDWLTSREPDWATGNFFAIHNWWHLALYHLDQRQWDAVISLYDDRIRVGRSRVVFDLLDASSLLWRLKLHGVEVGDRWNELADAWAPHLADAWYGFNDIHAMMAFVGAHRNDLAHELVARLATTAAAATPNARMTGEVALPIASGLLAFGEGRHADAIRLLSSARTIAARAGGSHAQRDVVGLTLLASAAAAGRRSLARALVNERLFLKPRSPLNLGWQTLL